ncbi:Cytochrome c-type biogenesis protein DsbD, protein-disulfide reductase [hydrothermal vent metagenome]|uniref:Cytochrome c-type biogenesis protein DsbD, protein-disulfide reductase n=1 Tax=hydrothermal vent metagenome TaxID=652676 RepID=A0A3B1BJ71_9ZZZZ
MKQNVWIICWLMAISLVSPLLHAEEALLPADEAYAFNARVLDADTIEAGWQIADNYYLYGNKIRFSSDTPGIRLGKPKLPKGKIKQDQFFGKLEVYRHKVQAQIPIIREQPGIRKFTLVAHSQGCADIGVCYPPHTQKITLTLPAATTTAPTKTQTNTPALQTLGAFGDSLGLGGGTDDGILDPDVAFKFSTELTDPNTIIARWSIAPDHYLYRDKFKFSLKNAAGISLGQVKLPKGELKHDEFFGQIQVFHNRVEARIPLLRSSQSATPITLHAVYQGCAEKTGICYPPIKKDISLELPATSQLASQIPAATISPQPVNTQALSDVEEFTQNLSKGSLLTVILTALGFGLMLAFTACMYPMIPILSSIIIGQGKKTSAAKGFGLSLIYVGAMALTFGIIGAITATVGEGAGIQAHFQSPWVLVPFALLFVALAFAMFGFYNIQIPSFIQSKLNMASNQQKGGSLVGVAIMGILSALIIGPCGGPILIAALTYAATSEDMVKGFIALFSLGAGMGLPLLVVGASGGKLLPKAGGWMNTVKAVAGVVLLAIAILMLERMPTLFSPELTMILWATLFITSAIYMRALEPLVANSSGWRTLWKGLGVALLLYGIIVMLGGLTGAKDVTHPLHGSSLTSGQIAATGAASADNSTSAHLPFTRIKTTTDLERELAKARASGKPVMLDFYADWCTYCKEYEQYVFPDPAVHAALKNFVLLQADVTAMDDEDKALMKRAQVILPPAILFFDPSSSKEQRSMRIVGSMTTDKFLAHVRKISPPKRQMNQKNE